MNAQQQYEAITSEPGKKSFIDKQVKKGKTEAEANVLLMEHSRKLRVKAMKEALGIR